MIYIIEKKCVLLIENRDWISSLKWQNIWDFAEIWVKGRKCLEQQQRHWTSKLLLNKTLSQFTMIVWIGFIYLGIIHQLLSACNRVTIDAGNSSNTLQLSQC